MSVRDGVGGAVTRTVLELEQGDRESYGVPHSGGGRTAEGGERRTINLIMVLHV